MTADTMLAPSLFELIGRQWTLPGPVGAARFNRDSSAVAFVSDTGLAIAAMADPERPDTRIRVAADTGRPTILPRTKPVRPLAEVPGAVGPVATWGDRSFVAASAAGGLVSVTPRGQAVPLPLRIDDPVTALARDPASDRVAVAAGRRVALLPEGDPGSPVWLEAPGPVADLAFSPDGTRLAVAHEGGVSVAADGKWTAGVAVEGTPERLSFSPDGALLACGLGEEGFALLRADDLAGEVVGDYPTPVRSFGWSDAGDALATSGAFRIVAWHLDGDGLGGPLLCGHNGLVIVDRISASPNRPLVAAGYASGLLSVARFGLSDEMLLRADGGAVTALEWSPDGGHLALGDARGMAAVVTFPPILFK